MLLAVNRLRENLDGRSKLIAHDEDNTELASFLRSVQPGTEHSVVGLRKPTKPKSIVHRFVNKNWISVVLLVQAILIAIAFGLLLATQSRVVFGVYVFLLLLRWINYPLAIAALFHDKKKWFAVIAGILYTACSYSGRLLVVAA